MNDSSSTTVSEWLALQTNRLSEAGVETPRLDALLLLCDEMGQEKAWVLAHPEAILQIEQVKKLNTKVVRRVHHTPLAYIRGHVEFYGRDFLVNERVLVPRPESESMIDLIKKHSSSLPQLRILDIGTGSGCLAVTAKLELQHAEVIAADIDPRALDVARTNAKAYTAAVTCIESDLLANIQGFFSPAIAVIVLANLPYVPASYPINKAASYEPRAALFSGVDGLVHYRRLFAEVTSLDSKPSFIITESLIQQHDQLASIAKRAGYQLVATEGLAQAFALAPKDQTE